MSLSIVGRPGSKSVKALVDSTSLIRYNKGCEAVINYGLAGKRFNAFQAKFPSLAKKIILNKFIGCSKLKAVNDAKAAGVAVPDSFLELPAGKKRADFLIKRQQSQGGVGIMLATQRKRKVGEYYQQFINNRKYELRIHAFSWLPEEEWPVQKRLGDKDTIAWNYKNGGTFRSVRNPSAHDVFRQARKIASTILKVRKMAFGAVDLIVTQDMQVLFIEINAAPGFTELSQPIYVRAFSELGKLSKKQLRSFCN